MTTDHRAFEPCARFDAMTNPGGDAGQTPSPEAGTGAAEPSSGGYEAPPIEQSQQPSDDAPSPSLDTPSAETPSLDTPPYGTPAVDAPAYQPPIETPAYSPPIDPQAYPPPVMRAIRQSFGAPPPYVGSHPSYGAPPSYPPPPCLSAASALRRSPAGLRRSPAGLRPASGLRRSPRVTARLRDTALPRATARRRRTADTARPASPRTRWRSRHWSPRSSGSAASAPSQAS